MQIPLDVLKDITRYSPIVSMDLIVETEGKVLLGLRTNRPAQGCWFVPGGRVAQADNLPAAFRHISKLELGTEFLLKDAIFWGVYDHFYADNFAGSPNFGTHYIVLAFKLKIDHQLKSLPADQHSAYRYWGIDELLRSAEVHGNTKAYFDERFIPSGQVALGLPKKTKF